MKKIISLISVVVFLVSCSSDEKNEDKQVTVKDPVAQYQLATVEKGGVATIVKLPAQLSAYLEVSIFPKVNGYVKDVLVDIGSHVRRGQLLMTLEAPELKQAALTEKEKYSKAQSDYIISKENYERLQQAAQTPGAVSPQDLSSNKAKVEANNALSEAAKQNWQMQETMLAYLNITAPFSGTITERNMHPGALVSAANKDKPMLELKEEDHLRLQVDVPENIAAHLKVKDSIYFLVSSFSGKRMKGIVSRKSDNINLQYRTERIEMDVMNDGSLAPGMYADVEIYSKGNSESLNVPRSAVVISTERKYVIVMRDNKMVRVDVTTSNESMDKVEISGALQAGEKVIVNANDEMR